jgi:hypothetical protein
MKEEDVIGFFKSLKMEREFKPTNLFETGLRKFYENPFTELLAFFLSEPSFPKRDEFTSLFLDLLLNESDHTEPQNIGSEIYVETQVKTLSGKFIDMILYNDKYVITLENKIYHWLENPLDDYVNQINYRFPNHHKYYIVFSLSKTTTPALWRNILISDVFKMLKKNISFSYQDKWDYFLNDFLDHYIATVEDIMDEKTFQFCAENFTKFLYGNELLNNFLNEIIKIIQAQYPDIEGIIRRRDKDSIISIEFYLSRDKNILLILYLTQENKYLINIYFNNKKYNCSLIDFGNRYNKDKEGIWQGYYMYPEKALPNVDEAITEIFELIKYIYNIINQENL